MTEGTVAVPVKKRGARPNSRLLLGMALGLCLGVFATLIVVFIDTQTHSWNKLQKLTVPITGSPLADALAEGGRSKLDRRFIGMIEYRSGIFRTHQEWDVYAGCLEDMSYGHAITVDFSSLDAPVITEAVAEQNGIRVRFDSGHELLIPTAMLGCGR